MSDDGGRQPWRKPTQRTRRPPTGARAHRRATTVLVTREVVTDWCPTHTAHDGTGDCWCDTPPNAPEGPRREHPDSRPGTARTAAHGAAGRRHGHNTDDATERTDTP
ncbi:hypothetical protein AB1484_27250 [Parafrankia sp. FMc6]|uniref:hypothetical protein n=1 Tax=Parafrankia soli TaxID=2599596 RepID=UPI0034D3A38F